MSRKALDIVLIPDGKLLDLAFSLNKQAIDAGVHYQLLGNTDFIPHLSLLQGVGVEETIPQIIEQLQKISADHEPVDLILSNIQHSWIELEKTSSLMRLQQDILNQIDPLLTHDATDADYDKDPGEGPITADCFVWLNDVRGKFSAEQYQPHITTGNSFAQPDIPLAQHFQGTHIALCTLGRYNTCRQILWSNKQ